MSKDKGMYEVWKQGRHIGAAFSLHGTYDLATAKTVAKGLDGLGFNYEIVATKDKSLVDSNYL